MDIALGYDWGALNQRLPTGEPEDSERFQRFLTIRELPTQDEIGIEIADEHITFKTTPVQELVNEYNTHFGSGLVMPNKEILKGW